MLNPLEEELEAVAGIDRVEPTRVEDPDVPLQGDVREDDLQDQAEPEDGKRQPEEAQRRRQVIERRVLAQGRVHADGDGDQQRQHLRRDDQLERHGQTLHQVRQDRPLAEDRPAEPVRERVADPVAVANDDRFVQVVLLLDERDRRPVDVRLHLHRLERIRRRRDEGEDEEARDEQDRNAVEQPPDDVRQHQSGASTVS